MLIRARLMLGGQRDLFGKGSCWISLKFVVALPMVHRERNLHTDEAEPPSLFGDGSRLDPDGALAGALGRPPRDDELKVWATMPAKRRENALRRINALRRWGNSQGEITAAEAANEAGVVVSRFYGLASAWQDSPSLHSVGTLAKRPGRKGPRLNGEVVNRIQSVLPRIVKAEKKSEGPIKVSALVARLAAEPELRDVELPHVNTLRSMVQRELRRARAEDQVGLRPGFDAIACDLLREDGTPFIIFGVIDRTSRIVLGFSLGDLVDSRAAFARAANDALERIQSAGASLPWADRTDRIDVIVGEDIEQWESLRADYLAAPIGPEFVLVTSDGRYGRYFRLIAGGKLGNMKIWQKRTATGATIEGGRSYTSADAAAAIEAEIARHNEEVLRESTAQGEARPAPQTVRMLDFIASHSSRARLGR